MRKYDARIAELPTFLARPGRPEPIRRVVIGDVTPAPRRYRRALGMAQWTTWEVIEVVMLFFFAGCLLGLCLVPR